MSSSSVSPTQSTTTTTNSSTSPFPSPTASRAGTTTAPCNLRRFFLPLPNPATSASTPAPNELIPVAMITVAMHPTGFIVCHDNVDHSFTGRLLNIDWGGPSAEEGFMVTYEPSNANQSLFVFSHSDSPICGKIWEESTAAQVEVEDVKDEEIVGGKEEDDDETKTGGVVEVEEEDKE